MIYVRLSANLFHTLFGTGIIDKYNHPIIFTINLQEGKVYFVNETSLKGPRSLRTEFYVYQLNNGYGIVCNGFSSDFDVERYNRLKPQFEYQFEIITDPEIINVMESKIVYKEKDSFLYALIPDSQKYNEFIAFHNNIQKASEATVLLHESKLKYLLFTHDANYEQIRKSTDLIIIELQVILNKQLLDESILIKTKQLLKHYRVQSQLIEEPLIKKFLQSKPGNITYDSNIAEYEYKVDIFRDAGSYAEYLNIISERFYKGNQRNIFTEIAGQANMAKHVNIIEAENRFRQNSVTNLFRVPGEIGGVSMDWDFQEELRKNHAKTKKKSSMDDID